MDTLVEIIKYLQRLQAYKLINYKRMLLIPELQDSFVRFIAGETLTQITDDGELLIPQSLYRAWIDKIETHGFDTEIDIKKYKALSCSECELSFVLPIDCNDSLCPVCSSKDHLTPKASCINPWRK
jgi:hypothetical protein